MSFQLLWKHKTIKAFANSDLTKCFFAYSNAASVITPVVFNIIIYSTIIFINYRCSCNCPIFRKIMNNISIPYRVNNKPKTSNNPQYSKE